jgi:hypothetical protein
MNRDNLATQKDLIELENTLRRDLRELEYRIIIKLGGLWLHRLRLSPRWLNCSKRVASSLDGV